MDSDMTAHEAFQQGDLTTALTLAADAVKAKPSNAASRIFLAELCCIVGDLERADKQLQTLITLDPESALIASNWRQLIRAAYARNAVFNDSEVPTLIGPATPAIEIALKQLVAVREGDDTAAPALLEQAQAAVLTSDLLINNQPVEVFRDLDDINAQVFEFLGTNGNYFWIDVRQIKNLEFAAPERPLDLLWRKCTIATDSGSDGVVFMPSIYPRTQDDSRQLLGRHTDWQDCNGFELGLGLREFLVDDEVMSVLDLQTIARV